MAVPAAMRVSDFDFDLPDDLIALRPASPREAARLLVVRPGDGLEDLTVGDLPGLLRAGDALVFNDTRVIPARLDGLREARAEGGGDGHPVAVEATLHKRLTPSRWSAFMRPGKRLKAGDRVRFGTHTDRACDVAQLDATVVEKGEGGEVVLAFDLSGPDLDIAINTRGHMPLPPYIAAKRPEDEQDRSDYQTVYAREDGSVAAPTAGLHFTPELLDRLAQAGVSQHFVTLHVGAGTFLPMKVEELADHRMHAEYGEVSADTAAALNAVRAAGGRIVCVGTTSLRLLESATGEDGVIKAWADETAIFITPGYRFRAADVLMTNFHLPRSTLFMLVSAFAGQRTMREAYAHAIATGYRFYSYGDGSLLFRAQAAIHGRYTDSWVRALKPRVVKPGGKMTNGVSADAQAMMAFESSKKSTGVAYLLLLFLGGAGVHRFYLGRIGSAVGQLALFILGWLTVWVGVGLFFLGALGVWLIVDLFLIPGIAQESNTALMKQLSARSEPAAPAVDELAKFAALRDQGAISEDEYEQQKRRLIGPMPATAPVVAPTPEAEA